MELLGIDVGGTGIKGAIVNSKTGELVSERLRLDTPNPSIPALVADSVDEMVKQFDYKGKVGCCFPTIIINGKAGSCGNIDESWLGVQVDQLFKERTGLDFAIINDADAAGNAEMSLGAGVGKEGLVMIITIGTGIGSGVFYNGVLIPNFELGRILYKKEPIEYWASDAARKKNKLSMEKWAERFDFYLCHLQRVFSPQLFIIGGGLGKKLDKFKDQLHTDVPIIPAKYGNNAGIIGAAMLAAE